MELTLFEMNATLFIRRSDVAWLHSRARETAVCFAEGMKGTAKTGWAGKPARAPHCVHRNHEARCIGRLFTTQLKSVKKRRRAAPPERLQNEG
ncbi:hypothetical protein B5X24_HaOG202908 [Helicoverpa armigera]|nr:hypothetical protein B5X24_HaOG202908 [Helicoverpa armigera]